MKLTKEQQKAQEFLASIYTKALGDKEFKQSLISNPIETLNTFTGKVANFPKDKKVLVQDQTNPNHIYLNIPAKPNLEDMELNEEQLEMVTGGEKIDWWGILAPFVWAYETGMKLGPE